MKTAKKKPIKFTESDWREIYYAVELKRLHVAEDNREHGRYADGVDLAAWRRQMERLADTLGPDGTTIAEALQALFDAADQVVRDWDQPRLQFAVQALDRALAPFRLGGDAKTK